MLKVLLAFLIFLSLVGCGRTLVDEVHDQARDAFESGDLARGSLLLVAGCNELHLQSVFLLRMVDYQSSRDVLEAMRAWSSIRALEPRYDFVEEVADELMHQFVRTMFFDKHNERYKSSLLN